MKKLILLLAALLAALNSALAAPRCPATGRIVDEQRNAVEYASVVLLRNGAQVAGMATDKEGRFELNVPAGDYTLSVQYLGYDPLQQLVRVEEQNELGEIVLKSSATAIEGVAVTASLIRREADRFIVDVANSPVAMGKDGIELLETAPGVYIDGEKITINGKSGSKVYVNDRELKYDPAQLIIYLQALKANEIQKIEVVPITGADYDANSSGGAIHITLTKRREDGMQGSLSLHTRHSSLINTYSPSGRINIRTGRLELYASAWGHLGTENAINDERTEYTTSTAPLISHSELPATNRNGGGSIGAIYEFDERNSIGGEFSYLHGGETTITTTQADMGPTSTRTDSRYENLKRSNGYEATLNYIRKIDTLGSTLKLLADFAHRTTNTDNDNFSCIVSPTQRSDSTFRDRTASSYSVFATTLALDKTFSSRWQLKAGAKYTRNSMDNDARYEFRKDQAWQPNHNQSFALNYTENIAAAYGIVTTKLGRWSAVAGLRGEYTRTEGKGDIGQSYFSLFPNANLSYSLSKDGAYSLIAQYARTITRPSFWMLTPTRIQLSDYTYQTGNPELAPSHTQEIGLTLVLKHKYTLSGGVNIITNELQQTMQPDPNAPDQLGLIWSNFDATTSYYLATNLPIQLTKWWSFNLGGTYVRRNTRIAIDGPINGQNIFISNASMSFTLPAKFYIDCSYRFSSRMAFGNCYVEPQHQHRASIKKRFGEQWTLSFTASNPFGRRQIIGAQGEGFTRMLYVAQSWNNATYNFGVSFNFKSGKSFKSKSVEAGASEEKGRM